MNNREILEKCIEFLDYYSSLGENKCDEQVKKFIGEMEVPKNLEKELEDCIQFLKESDKFIVIGTKSSGHVYKLQKGFSHIETIGFAEILKQEAINKSFE